MQFPPLEELSGIKLIISDLDGTLAYTQTANHAAYSQAFKELGVEYTEQHAAQTHGMRFDDLVQHVAPELTSTEQQSIREQKKQYYPQHFDKLVIHTDLIDFLRSAASAGIRIAVASTASRANGMKVLEACGLLDIVEITIFGDDVKRGKPHPESFEKCMDLAQASPDETLIFEDSSIGLQAADASGARVIAIDEPWWQE